MRKEEISNVLGLSPLNRYKYFIKKIADLEELWLLSNDNGDIALSRDDDKYLLPLWTAEEFINSCRNEEWDNYQPLKINLETLINNIFPLILEYNMLINVFPVMNKSGFVVSYEEFVRDLNEELENYS